MFYQVKMILSFNDKHYWRAFILDKQVFCRTTVNRLWRIYKKKFYEYSYKSFVNRAISVNETIRQFIHQNEWENLKLLQLYWNEEWNWNEIMKIKMRFWLYLLGFFSIKSRKHEVTREREKFQQLFSSICNVKIVYDELVL